MRNKIRSTPKHSRHWVREDSSALSGKRHAQTPPKLARSSAPIRTSDGSDDRLTRGEMLKTLCGVGDFLRRMRTQARFGSLSRAPLKLLRFALRGSTAECDWIARPPDEWDSTLPKVMGERHASRQALEDAIALRAFLFRAIPGVESAVLQAYRKSQCDRLELIVRGQVCRAERAPVAARSLVMRAKLCGFQFCLDDGVLEALRVEEFHLCVHGAINGVRSDQATFY